MSDKFTCSLSFQQYDERKMMFCFPERQTADFSDKCSCTFRLTSCCSPAVNHSTWCTSRRQNWMGQSVFCLMSRHLISFLPAHLLFLLFPLLLVKLLFLFPTTLCSFSLYRPPLLLFLRETNLKVRQALTVTGDLGEDIEKLADFNGKTARVQPTVGF